MIILSGPLHEQLAIARRLRGLTQQQAADAAGIHVGLTISEHGNGIAVELRHQPVRAEA